MDSFISIHEIDPTRIRAFWEEWPTEEDGVAGTALVIRGSQKVEGELNMADVKFFGVSREDAMRVATGLLASAGGGEYAQEIVAMAVPEHSILSGDIKNFENLWDEVIEWAEFCGEDGEPRIHGLAWMSLDEDTQEQACKSYFDDVDAKYTRDREDE